MIDIFSALADPNRRNIIELLSIHGQLTASEIYDNFSVSHPAISQHLKVLKESELVLVEKKAQQRIYKLNPLKINELEKWIKKLTEDWEERFGRLDRILVEEKKLRSHR